MAVVPRVQLPTDENPPCAAREITAPPSARRRRMQSDVTIIDPRALDAEARMEHVEDRVEIAHAEATADCNARELGVGNLDRDRRIAVQLRDDLAQRLAGENQVALVPGQSASQLRLRQELHLHLRHDWIELGR